MWTKQQTCPGPRLCTSFELCEKDRQAIKNDDDLHRWVTKWRTWPDRPKDDPFYWCMDCKKIRRAQLIECPSCGKFFKGPRPNFPIDYECENCE